MGFHGVLPGVERRDDHAAHFPLDTGSLASVPQGHTQLHQTVGGRAEQVPAESPARLLAPVGFS